jgi:hypothetical protein
MKHSRITGTGSYLPERILTNAELERSIDTTDEWIFTRTGIRERHIVAEGQYTSDMALEAAKKAIEAANIDIQSIDLIVLATTTPDRTFPSTACLLQKLQDGVSGVHTLSHGEIFTLEEIAYGIFRYFGCEELLKLDTIKPARFDIRDKSYLWQRTSICSFRPTMKGLLEYVEKNI